MAMNCDDFDLLFAEPNSAIAVCNIAAPIRCTICEFSLPNIAIAFRDEKFRFFVGLNEVHIDNLHQNFEAKPREALFYMLPN